MKFSAIGLIGGLLSATQAGCLLPELGLMGQDEGGARAGSAFGQGERDPGLNRDGASGAVLTVGNAGSDPASRDVANAVDGSSFAGTQAMIGNGAGNTGGQAGRTGTSSGKVAASAGGGVSSAGGGGTPATGSGDDACASSMCNTDYPCGPLASGGYTCRGQFADWSPTYDSSAFKDNGDGTVTDSRNGLVWQGSVVSSYAPACSGMLGAFSPVGDGCTWEDAKKYCSELSLAAATWRLPTVAELESLVDDSRYAPAIDPGLFPGSPSGDYWSSSHFVGAPDKAWTVDFESGGLRTWAITTVGRVRCVR